MTSNRLIFLLIMDGWGINTNTKGNAIKLAKCSNLPLLEKTYPHTELSATGLDVGLPKGLMGNSEVGHLNIGAGRVVWQEITRIDRAIEDKTFFTNPELVAAMNYAKTRNTSLHLIGLVSDGGVHSSDNHYFALLEMVKQIGLKPDKVFFHAVLDGRDTPPTSGVGYIEKLVSKMKQLGIGQIATIVGRYYLMDRDKRWERLQKAYDALTLGEGYPETEPISAIRNAYTRNETDEFIKPIIITDENKQSIGRIKDNDSIIFFNFRADRAREIARSLTEPGFKEFPRKVFPKVFYTTMTQYDEKFTFPVAFKPVHLKNILGECLSNNNLKQLRIAETEKYAHVTYFFNGGEEKPFAGEDRILVPSPKIPTYDMQPEMNAFEVTREVLKAIESKKYNVIILNFANCDMVGHTGILSAAIQAVETVDKCVGEIVSAVKKQDGFILITSDHGNAEEMIDNKTNGPHTYHTINPVPFTLVANDCKNYKLCTGGKLCDIAPTILHLLDIPKPAEMEGTNLVLTLPIQ